MALKKEIFLKPLPEYNRKFTTLNLTGFCHFQTTVTKATLCQPLVANEKCVLPSGCWLSSGEICLKDWFLIILEVPAVGYSLHARH